MIIQKLNVELVPFEFNEVNRGLDVKREGREIKERKITYGHLYGGIGWINMRRRRHSYGKRREDILSNIYIGSLRLI